MTALPCARVASGKQYSGGHCVSLFQENTTSTRTLTGHIIDLRASLKLDKRTLRQPKALTCHWSAW